MSLQSPLLSVSSRLLQASNSFSRPVIHRKTYPRRRAEHILSTKQVQRRTFLSPASILSGSESQHISVSRVLPYPSLPVFTTIANVPSYSSFLPYCLSSNVTHWSPGQDSMLHKRWPARAELLVGWGAIQEQFVSQIYCVPSRGIVEAIAGEGQASVGGDDIRHYRQGSSDAQQPGTSKSADEPGPRANDNILSHLATRWQVKPLGSQAHQAGTVVLGNEEHPRTQVTLDIEVQFASPVYAAMSKVVADQVAEKMIEAFQVRIEEDLQSQRGKSKSDSSDSRAPS